MRLLTRATWDFFFGGGGVKDTTCTVIREQIKRTLFRSTHFVCLSTFRDN
jgi:hypothetical protein